MQKIRIFLNQNASQGNQVDWQSLVRKRLFRSDLEFVNPQSHEDFLAEIDRATRDDIDVIISIGGDGTFHSLIQKLANKNIGFLVLPAGTANDFARSTGMFGLRFLEALDCVRRGNFKNIDLIDVNGSLLATNSGLGVVAEVAIGVNQLRKAVPGFKRMMSVAKQEVYSLILASRVLFSKIEYHHLHVSCDVFTGSVKTPLLMINNQPCIAGSFMVAPQTKHDDGRFNVTIFLHESRSDLLSAIYRIRQGIPPENDPYILSFETDALHMQSVDGREIPFIGDGELLSVSREFHVKILPKTLRVFAESCERLIQSEITDALDAV